MDFTNIPGLSTIKHQLIKTAQHNRIPHAQLFFGAQGALTLPLALAYAAYLHCPHKHETGNCTSCSACHKNKKYIHPDTCFIFPLINSHSNKAHLKVNLLKDWRAFLLEQPFGTPDDWVNYHGSDNKHPLISREQSQEILKVLSLKTFESSYKIILIWQPELMHPTAANGILKILEEPPPNSVFILASNAAEKLIPTILSRVQAIQIPLLSDDTIRAFLQKEFTLNEPRTNTILQLADGDLSRACQLAVSDQNIFREDFINWMRACFKEDYKTLTDMAEQFHKTGKLVQQNQLQYANMMLRETLLCLAGAASISRSESDESSFILNFSKVLSTQKIEHLNSHISTAQRRLKQNGSAKIIFLSLSLQCATLLKAHNS